MDGLKLTRDLTCGGILKMKAVNERKGETIVKKIWYLKGRLLALTFGIG